MSAVPGGVGGSAMGRVESTQLQIVTVDQEDPLASPLLEELALEYSSRYGRSPGEQYSALRAYPAAEFAPPGGVLIIALLRGIPVAGGAFRQYDDTTAELKRIWTASAYRGRGHGKTVVAHLETIAVDYGYRRIFLTTGWNQPEAVALYLAAGYTPLYDTTLPSAAVGVHPFEKDLPVV